MEKYILIITIIIAAVAAIYFVVTYPKKAKEWLLWAVIQAEKELGSRTGQLKLRRVYEMFLIRFPKLAAFISFETFSKWVDIALDKMESLISANAKIEDFVIKK